MSVETPTAKATEDKSITQETKKYEVIGRGKKWVYQNVVQTKGKGVGSAHNYLDANGPYDAFISQVRDAVGPENFYKVIQAEIIRPYCRDAEHDLNAKMGDVEWTPEQWIECFFNQFLPGGRSERDGVKQIREQLKTVMADIKPLMERYMKKDTRDAMSVDEVNRLLMLQTQFGELCEKEEKGSRKGKKGTKVATEAKK